MAKHDNTTVAAITLVIMTSLSTPAAAKCNIEIHSRPPAKYPVAVSGIGMLGSLEGLNIDYHNADMDNLPYSLAMGGNCDDVSINIRDGAK